MDYPKTHDLEPLIAILTDLGQSIPEGLQRLEYLTDFAVLFRYTISEQIEEPLDRAALMKDVAVFVEFTGHVVEPPR